LLKTKITIPKKLREKLDINVGDMLVLDVEGDKIILRKEELELSILKGGKGLSDEKIEESIKKGLNDE